MGMVLKGKQEKQKKKIISVQMKQQQNNVQKLSSLFWDQSVILHPIYVYGHFHQLIANSQRSYYFVNPYQNIYISIKKNKKNKGVLLKNFRWCIIQWISPDDSRYVFNIHFCNIYGLDVYGFVGMFLTCFAFTLG